MNEQVEMAFDPGLISVVKGGLWVGRPKRRPDDRVRGGYYHLVNQMKEKGNFFDEVEKEGLRRLVWAMADFLLIEIKTFAILKDHFHLLVRVPPMQEWQDRFCHAAGQSAFLEHLRTYYPRSYVEGVKRELQELRETKSEEDVQYYLERFTRRFGDLGSFGKEVQERYSRWFNKRNCRRGVLWRERFKSVCLRGEQVVLRRAALLDAAPVIHGLVPRAEQYAFCGFGAAVMGGARERRALCDLLGVSLENWETHAMPAYRALVQEALEKVGQIEALPLPRRGRPRKARA